VFSSKKCCAFKFLRSEYRGGTDRRNKYTMIPNSALVYSIPSQRLGTSRLVYTINYQLVHDKSGQNDNKRGTLERVPLGYLAFVNFSSTSFE
jgi:hypothetical protein